jgi:DNA repair protein RecN (Recombination protein N)
VAALQAEVARTAAETEDLTYRLSELDRLDPRSGEETALAEERAVLGASEKALSDIAAARAALDGLGSKVIGAIRALERARERAVSAGAASDGAAATRLITASEALNRVLIEADEAQSAVEGAALAFDFEPNRLEKTEERLFDLRGLARKLGATVESLPQLRVQFAARLRAVETSEVALKAAQAELAAARAAYLKAAEALAAARQAAGTRLAEAVMAELAPLKLDKARFRVAVEVLAEDRAGPLGMDRTAFEIATNPGAPFGDLGAIASGGELARFALALKASLAGRASGPQPLMIFDEVDQGVGGAVADAVGLRLKRLAENAQVLVVTHSPQVAARAEAHWRIAKAGEGERLRTAVEVLTPADREEEIARMLAGAQITDAARAAARALMEA